MNAIKISFKRGSKQPFKFFVSQNEESYVEVPITGINTIGWDTFEKVKGRFLKVTFPEDKQVFVNEIRVQKANRYPDLDE